MSCMAGGLHGAQEQQLQRSVRAAHASVSGGTAAWAGEPTPAGPTARRLAAAGDSPPPQQQQGDASPPPVPQPPELPLIRFRLPPLPPFNGFLRPSPPLTLDTAPHVRTADSPTPHPLSHMPREKHATCAWNQSTCTPVGSGIRGD